jgi:predicted transposase/invertase (TIGR01784 family)
MCNKNKIFFDETDDLIDIRYDNVFKAVFTRNTPQAKIALSELVSALIKRDVSIVTILANEPPVNDINDRQIRFDINCRAESGELIDVEMSLNPNKFEPVRLEFYAGKLFTGQDIKGTEKNYSELKEAYQIAILVKERFFKDDTFYHSFEYYDHVNSISLKGRTRIITLELSKLDKVLKKPTDEMTLSEKWAFYFQYLTDREKRGKINEIIEQNNGIAMASEVLMTVSRDEHERAWLLSKEKYILDRQSELSYAKEEGREEERIEIARNALEKGYTLEQIQEITGLDPETIKEL